MEIIIIIIIIIVIVFMMGGLNPMVLTSETLPYTALRSNQWHCEEPLWVNKPQWQGSELLSKLKVECRLEAVSGGGILELSRFLDSQVAVNAYEMHSFPQAEQFEGMPSTLYDVTVEAKENPDSRGHYLRGHNHIATDGHHLLKTTFIGKPDDSSSWVKSMRTDMTVRTALMKHWYHLEMVHENAVRKPWYVPAGTFREAMENKLVEEMKKRSETLVTSLANNL